MSLCVCVFYYHSNLVFYYCTWYVIMIQDHRYLESPILDVQTVYVTVSRRHHPNSQPPHTSNNVQNHDLSPTTSSQWYDVHTQMRIK
jgi:hypothetical protein